MILIYNKSNLLYLLLKNFLKFTLCAYKALIERLRDDNNEFKKYLLILKEKS